MGRLESLEGLVGVVGGFTLRNFPSRGWVTFSAVDAFDGTISVEVRLVGGSPKLVGLRLKASEGEDGWAVLDASTVARLPLRNLTIAAARSLRLKPDGSTDASEEADEMPAFWLPDAPPLRPRGGSDDFSAWLADAYNRAHAQGMSARAVLAEALGVSPKRVDQLIREARDRGKLPEDPTQRSRDRQFGAAAQVGAVPQRSTSGKGARQ